MWGENTWNSTQSFFIFSENRSDDELLKWNSNVKFHDFTFNIDFDSFGAPKRGSKYVRVVVFFSGKRVQWNLYAHIHFHGKYELFCDG